VPLAAYLPGGSYRSWEETVKGLRRSVV
jgi:hypothetical protein